MLVSTIYSKGAPGKQPRKKKRGKGVSNGRKVNVARRQAVLVLKEAGQEVRGDLANLVLVNKLVETGKLADGFYGRKKAGSVLVAWYDRLDTKIKGTRDVAKPRNVQTAKPQNVKSDEFLESWEWTNLRYRVLQFHGRKCQCCGAQPPAVVLHVDHIKPRSLYPELAMEFDNLQVLCAACNKGKSNKHFEDFRLKLVE